VAAKVAVRVAAKAAVARNDNARSIRYHLQERGRRCGLFILRSGPSLDKETEPVCISRCTAENRFFTRSSRRWEPWETAEPQGL